MRDGVLWTILVNQTVLADMTVTSGGSTIAAFDQWGGYPAARRRLLAAARDAGVANLMVVPIRRWSRAAGLSSTPATRAHAATR